MKKRGVLSFWKRPLTLLLTAALLFSAAPAALAEGTEERSLHIGSAEELRAFSAACALDSASLGLHVFLDRDIDLEDEPFTPIPSFSGVFDGQGHSILNLRLATDGSHQGLFRYIQKEGAVRDLHVEGAVAPENGRCQLGGLAGTNYGTVENCSFTGTVSGLNQVGGLVGENAGLIRGCQADGTVDGKRYTGGVAGWNEGGIEGCVNLAKVNTSITEGGLELERLSLAGLSGLELTSAEDTDIVSDSGGIAGYSSGRVEGCVNRGAVGYPHYGYNVGGVAGRQSGSLRDCENHGAVQGRKDVGGIVGQMEPYLLLKDVQTIGEELETLNALVSDAMRNLSNMSWEMRQILEKIRGDDQETPPEEGGETASEPGTVSSAGTGGGILRLSAGGRQTPDLSEQSPAPEQSPPPEQDPGAEQSPPPEQDPGAEQSPPPEQDPGAEQSPAPEQDPLPELPPDFSFDLPTDFSGRFEDLVWALQELLRVMSASNGELAGDLVRVSEQLSVVISMMADALSGEAQRQVFEDISGEVPEEDSQGRVSGCVNRGAVEGDRCVGGVAGAMGIEVEFDLEGTLARDLSMGSIFTSTYQTKCVCSGNVNRGEVAGRWDEIGGVAGRAELGLITGCSGFGGVSSSDGSYAGGVAGWSEAAIRSCQAICGVSGLEYVGGIAGQGQEIRGCVSLVGLDGATACAGAIAGWADMSADLVTENVFVHESLGGVDGISYGGRAEPVGYEALLAREDLPEEFRSLTLRFVADGETVAEISFPYGGSLDPSQIPPVPEKEGASGRWPDYDYSRLTFSDTLEAVYTSRQAALASAETRDGGPQSLMLAEGDFSDGAELTLSSFNGPGPETEGTVLEKWAVRLRDEAYEGAGYTLRYLPPELEKGKAVRLWLYEDGAWRPLAAGSSGSYLTFAASGDTLVFCAEETERAAGDYTLLFAGAAALLSLAALGILIRRSRARRRKKKARAAKAARGGGE